MTVYIIKAASSGFEFRIVQFDSGLYNSKINIFYRDKPFGSIFTSITLNHATIEEIMFEIQEWLTKKGEI